MLDELRGFDAILLGAVGTPEVPPGVHRAGAAAQDALRARPLHQPAPVQSAGRHSDGVDFVVIRENTEGPYAGEGGSCARARRTRSPRRARSTPAWASSAASATRSSWPTAATRKHLTLVHKTNVLTFAGDLWQRTFDEVAAEYPDVATAYNHVDAACIYFVQDPQRYDVIVTDNLFGDILTDLGGAVSGGIGLRALGQPQPGPHRPVDVRAGARLGARHRRHRARPTRPRRSCRPR